MLQNAPLNRDNLEQDFKDFFNKVLIDFFQYYIIDKQTLLNS